MTFRDRFRSDDMVTCAKVQAIFPDYCDGTVSGRTMQSISAHLKACPSCDHDFAAWQALQRTLASLPSPKAPAELGLKLRIAISQQQARQQVRWYQQIGLAWENALRPLVFQVSAGFAGTVILIGAALMMLGMFAAPDAVLANDEPLSEMTQPHFLYSVGPTRPNFTTQESALIVQARVNEEGRIYDYTILVGPNDDAIRLQLDNELMLSVYEPARIFGSPVRGTVLLAFSGVSIRS